MIAQITGDLTCRLAGERTWSREVGYCTTAGGIDINKAIIAQGAALPCPRYDDRYALYCGPVLRHSAEPIQAANFRSAVAF